MAASILSARRFAAALCCGALLALTSAARVLPAQEPEQSKEPAADQRLDSIEKALQSLIKEVQSLKQPGSKAETPPAARTASTSATTSATAKAPDLEIDAKWLKSLNWRSIGPANMGGRITDI